MEYDLGGLQMSFLKYLPKGWHPIAEPAILIAFYFSVIVALKVFMRNRPAFNLEKILKVHNVILAVMSAGMFLLYLWGIVEAFLEDGVFGTFCTSRSHNGKIFLAMEVYYLSKIPEFLDTWFLVLKKRDLTLLHVWHHSSVVFVSWLAVYDKLLFGWITGFNNVFVHIFMYSYYVVATKTNKPWWGRYLTTMQIVQFVIDVVTSIPWLFYHYGGVECLGTVRSFWIGNFIGSSYLVLFVLFYRRTYKKPTTGSASASQTKAKKVE